MPLWKVYHPVGAYSEQDKRQMAETIVSFYPMLPDFYVGVVFEEVTASSFFIGGKPMTDFVRISVDHIARQFPDDAMREKWMNNSVTGLKPFTVDKGLDWEMHVDETPFKLWRIQGLRPPMPNSHQENLWKAENRAVPYDDTA